LIAKEYEAQNRAYYDSMSPARSTSHEYLGFALRPLAEHSAPSSSAWHAEFIACGSVP